MRFIVTDSDAEMIIRAVYLQIEFWASQPPSQLRDEQCSAWGELHEDLLKQHDESDEDGEES